MALLNNAAAKRSAKTGTNLVILSSSLSKSMNAMLSAPYTNFSRALKTMA